MIASSSRPIGGVFEGVFTMKKIVTFAALAGGALVLAACGGKTEEAPVAEPAAEETVAADAMMADDAMAEDAAAAAAEGTDPNGNPIGPAADAATSAEAAPAAE